MKVTLDEKEYTLPLSDVLSKVSMAYTFARQNRDSINDPKIAPFIKNSLIRTGIKSAITPFILPLLRQMYKEKDLVLLEPEKHTDLIDYVVRAFLTYFDELQKKTHVYFTSEIDENSGYTIKSVSTSGQKSLN